MNLFYFVQRNRISILSEDLQTNQSLFSITINIFNWTLHEILINKKSPVIENTTQPQLKVICQLDL